jgi:serine/threonine protein kinase
MPLPQRLGRLRQIERLGAGGFATVWRYRDDELDSDVAVKALADNWAQRSDVRERFLEEARILRRADADHVVRVYDTGATESGTPYFVMSYADRGTVADLMAQGRPSVEESLEIVRQAGAGLAVLHRQGIIHRDIKPQNLLLRSLPEGGAEVLVADLGVAKAVAHGSGLTQVVGTPAYIAPEQALGQGLDIRADVHALGAVAYVLLTGRLVREDGIASLVAAELPPAPSQVAEVPARLDAPVLKALAIDPDHRWPDIPSFLAALDEAAPEDPAPRGRSRPLPLLGLVLLVLALTFGISYVVTSLIR